MTTLEELLKSDSSTVALKASGYSLIWAYGDWEVRSMKGLARITHYQGAELSEAIECFVKMAGVEIEDVV